VIHAQKSEMNYEVFDWRIGDGVLFAVYMGASPRVYIGVRGEGGSSASIYCRNGVPYIQMSSGAQRSDNLEFALIDEEPYMFVTKGNESIGVNLFEAAKRYAALGPPKWEMKEPNED